MARADKPYVHMTIDAVDTVVFDPDGLYDPERHDRYSSFTEAHNAAISSVELILDEGDYDGDDHREELERMLHLLEAASTFDELDGQADYHWFLNHLDPARPHAA